MSSAKKQNYNQQIQQLSNSIQLQREKLDTWARSINSKMTAYHQLPQQISNVLSLNSQLKQQIKTLKTELARMEFNDTHTHFEQFTDQQAVQQKLAKNPPCSPKPIYDQQQQQSLNESLNISLPAPNQLPTPNINSQINKPQQTCRPEFEIKLMFRRYKHDQFEASKSYSDTKKMLSKLDKQIQDKSELKIAAEAELQRITSQLTTLEEQKRKDAAEIKELQKMIAEAQENLMSLQSQISNASTVQKLSSQLQFECVQLNQKKEQVKTKIKQMQVFMGQIDVKSKPEIQRFLDSIK